MIRYFMAFEGVYSIIPTAFTESGDIDEASQRRVVDLFIDKGANGLTALGVTGEVARLEEHERAKVLEIVVKQANGRVPIIAGTSAEGTRTCISYTRQAKDLGGRHHSCLPSPRSMSTRIASDRLRPFALAHRSRRPISACDSRMLMIGRIPVGGRPGLRFFCLTDIDLGI